MNPNFPPIQKIAPTHAHINDESDQEFQELCEVPSNCILLTTHHALQRKYNNLSHQFKDLQKEYANLANDNNKLSQNEKKLLESLRKEQKQREAQTKNFQKKINQISKSEQSWRKKFYEASEMNKKYQEKEKLQSQQPYSYGKFGTKGFSDQEKGKYTEFNKVAYIQNSNLIKRK